MDAALTNQITSLDEARAFITQLRSEFQQTLAQLQTENQLLRQKLEFFIKRYFGGTKIFCARREKHLPRPAQSSR